MPPPDKDGHFSRLRSHNWLTGIIMLKRGRRPQFHVFFYSLAPAQAPLTPNIRPSRKNSELRLQFKAFHINPRLGRLQPFAPFGYFLLQ